MKDINWKYPVVVIVLAIAIGFLINMFYGMNFDENLTDMTKTSKLLTYGVMFVVLLVWKNYKKKP